MSEEARKLAKANGGVWSEHLTYALKDWRAQVANDYTRQGYWDWVLRQMEDETHEL